VQGLVLKLVLLLVQLVQQQLVQQQLVLKLVALLVQLVQQQLVQQLAPVQKLFVQL
jgi:hypothetical protein